MRRVVIQSYRTDDVPAWIEACLDSVRRWAEAGQYTYTFVGDEIFDLVPAWYRDNAGGRAPVITDLARLLLAREILAGGADQVIWLDADMLVFDHEGLKIDPELQYAFGREYWVQPGKGDRSLKVYRNVHNAIAVFAPDNPFLEFYIHACERIIAGASGSVPNQVVGTKFLTAVHNIMGLPLIENVGMLSPLVLADVAAGGGAALERLTAVSKFPLAAANLCSSLAGGEADGVLMNDPFMLMVCERLLEDGGWNHTAAE